MCGKGVLTYTPTRSVTLPKGYANYEGTFCEDKFEGIGKQTWPDFTYEGEYKMGKRHGNCTVYTNCGRVLNKKYIDGKEVVDLHGDPIIEEVTDPHQAWYGNGRPRPVNEEEDTDPLSD